MTSRRHRLNLLWVASLAIAGMFSAVGPARACSEVRVPKACCEAAPEADCHCCGSADSSAVPPGSARPHGVEWTRSAAATRPVAATPRSSCECRPNAPPAPAQRPDSRTTDESRTDRGHTEVIAYLGHAPRPALPASRLRSEPVSPPKAPLYLRTLHLLV